MSNIQSGDGRRTPNSTASKGVTPLEGQTSWQLVATWLHFAQTWLDDLFTMTVVQRWRHVMGLLIADDSMITLLNQARELTEIRDTSGRVVGFFAPVASECARLYANAASRIDPRRIEERRNEKGHCSTTREMFEHLKALTNDAAANAHLDQKLKDLKERDECGTR